MPWNQPRSGGNNNDHVGHRDSRGDRQNGPPDLDQIFRDARKRLDAILGGGRGGRNGGDKNGKKSGGSISNSVIAFLAVVGFGAWLASGIYTVDQQEQAVELRFGKYSETNNAGLNWHWPAPFESVEIINTQNVNTVEVGYRESGRNVQSIPREALMLTEDENIIDIQFAIQYDIKNPTDLLFNVSEYNPRDIADTVVRQATESAVRGIVGRNKMDFAITDGRAQLAAETKALVQDILDRYKTGVNIRSVEMQNAQPPAQVKDAFDDVVRAREDEERLKNLAEAYANDVIPRARGFSARILQEAEAYKSAIVAKAKGEASRFAQVLDEYTKAPSVTRERLYLETMEQVLTNSSKMIIDQQEGSNSVMYLPLDQLIRSRSINSGFSESTNSEFNTPSPSPSPSTESSDSTSPSNTNNLRPTGRSIDRTGRQ